MTKSAAFFAVRVLTDPDAPPSAGAYRPIEVIAPEGCLLNARPPAAVAAGNVETSSRVADLVIAALGGARPVPAQGQGTMNNLTLAGEGFTYYETLGGGQGACPDADGPSAIHVAMSNTLNTPVEALETEFPLRVRELSVRRGSGGEGRHRGGDGIVREIEALAPMRFTLITERRRHPPRGRDGGDDGAPGRNLLNGEPLPSKAEGDLRPGDMLRIETPGGGGDRLKGAVNLAIRPASSKCSLRAAFVAWTGFEASSSQSQTHRPSQVQLQMPIAFKEWAVTVRALAEGEQLLTLRKGGIREENKHFELEHERFFLYPTFDHQRNDLVRESHHPELRRALEEGVWPDEEPPPRALLQDGGIAQPDRVRLRAWAEVTDHVTITDPRVVDALSPFYVWTPDYAEKRLNWKRRHPLHILLLRVHRIPRPVTVRVREEYHGCRSWVEIDRDLPFEGTPVMADEEFDRARQEIKAVCAGEPVLSLRPGLDRCPGSRPNRLASPRATTAATPPSPSARWTAWRSCGCGSRTASRRCRATSPSSSTPTRPGSRSPTRSCPRRAGRRRRPGAATWPAGRWRPSCTSSTTPTWSAAPPARTRARRCAAPPSASTRSS